MKKSLSFIVEMTCFLISHVITSNKLCSFLLFDSYSSSFLFNWILLLLLVILISCI
jgi:hypothetical protein